MNWLAKIKLRGPGPPGSILSLIAVVCVYCCTAKLLKETETEETIVLFVIFLSLVAFQLGGGGGGGAGPPWLRVCFEAKNLKMCPQGRPKLWPRTSSRTSPLLSSSRLSLLTPLACF